MLPTLCPGCRQPLDAQSSDCRYCGPLRSRTYIGRHLADRQVWCASQQQLVVVSWTGAGQAYLCVCSKVHEVVECGACGKAWGTAVNSFGELDRTGLRRCAACRIPSREPAAPSACTLCGPHSRHPARRPGRGLRLRKARRRRRALECLECRAPVGWWQHRRQRSQRSLDVSAATFPAEFDKGAARWNGHGDEDQFVSGDPGAAGESAAA